VLDAAAKEVVVFHGIGSLSNAAMKHILHDHYLKRRPPMSDTFEMWDGDNIVAVATFGVPASRHLQKSACPSDPDAVVELNRLWVAPEAKKGTASFFIARCLKAMPPRIIVSYADTSAGHEGFVYRASNFYYAGWTDMDRKTPRFDYLVESGLHTRDAFRKGQGASSKKVRRKPKVKYWTTTGTRRDKKRLEKICGWPKLSWRDLPPVYEHRKETNI
jgi:hypothetical protein